MPALTATGFTLFDTPIGPCALAWRAQGLVGVFLPELDATATRARVQRRFAGAEALEAPPAVQDAVARVVALLNGAPDDLRGIELDLGAIPAFNRRVYEIARTIPPGQTLTYGGVAERLGEPHAARAVGQALGANPFPIVVPCHRVLAAHGQGGGFSAPGGTRTKLKLLEIERAPLGGRPGLFD